MKKFTFEDNEPNNPIGWRLTQAKQALRNLGFTVIEEDKNLLQLCEDSQSGVLKEEIEEIDIVKFQERLGVAARVLVLAYNYNNLIRALKKKGIV